MKNKIDIGVFVKKAFENDKYPYEPNERVLERIDKTIDKPKRNKNKLLFWFSFSVLFIGTVSYLGLDTIYSNSQSENRNITTSTSTKKQSNELSQEEVFGPKLISEIKNPNQDTISFENTPHFYSFILDTTSQNPSGTRKNKPKVNLGNTNYDINQFFNQKTIYHYYRASDSLRIQTTDKKIIDSIMSNKKSHNSIDDFQ